MESQASGRVKGMMRKTMIMALRAVAMSQYHTLRSTNYRWPALF
jgi:hypothetical protein